MIVNLETYNKIFSNLIKVVTCDIKHLSLYSQELTFEELSLLPMDQIQTVELSDVTVIKEGHVFPVEKLICLFPNATHKL